MIIREEYKSELYMPFLSIRRENFGIDLVNTKDGIKIYIMSKYLADWEILDIVQGITSFTYDNLNRVLDDYLIDILKQINTYSIKHFYSDNMLIFKKGTDTSIMKAVIRRNISGVKKDEN